MPDRPLNAPSNLAENQTYHFRLLHNPESAKAKRLTIWLSIKGSFGSFVSFGSLLGSPDRVTFLTNAQFP